MTMAKGQQRGNKEAKKPKSGNPKSGPKYMAAADLGPSTKFPTRQPAPKK
jgi:hypothetical protein